MNTNLKQALTKQKKASQPLELSGTLGIAINGQRTVEVENRNGFVYVQLRNNQNELIQALNDKVSPVYGLPVIVVRQGNRYVIKGRDTERYTDWESFSSFLPRHGDQHSFNDVGGGGDLVWVYGRQFMPMLVMPSGSLGGPNLVVSEYVIKDARGNWRYSGNTGTPDILGYKPQGTTAVVGLVAINRTTGNPRVIINSGTFMPGNLTGTADLIPYLPQLNDADLLPAMAFRIASGTASLGWGNLYDIRQYYNEPFQGSSANIYFLTSGSSGVSGFDLMTVGRPTGSYYSYSSAISATGTLLADFITEPNVPNAAFISDGIYHLHIHAQRTAGTKDARLRYVFGKISSGGLQTLLHTSELSNLIGNSEQEFDIESLEPEHSLETSDRLWTNIYAVPEGGGSTPTISIKIDGDTLSRFEIPSISSTSSGGGGTPGGSDTQVQFNQSNAFAGDSRFIWDYTNGYLRIGPAHPYNFNNSQLQMIGASPNSTPTMALLAYGTGTANPGSPHPTWFGCRQRGNSVNSPEGILDNDGLFLLVGAGYDGANLINSARLRFSAQGDWVTGTYTGSKAEIQITPSGTNTRFTRFEVVGNGANIPDGTWMVGGNPHAHNGLYQPSGTTIPLSGWIPETHVWTFRSSDAPSYVVSLNADVSTNIGVGMKAQLDHQGSTKNFFITALSVTGTTTWLNLYGGTDYTLNVTGTITNTKYSGLKAPYGFPLDATKWRQTLTNTSLQSQVTVGVTVYNLGSLSISAPIGLWIPKWNVATQWNHASIGEHYMYVSLSTANNAHNAAMSFSFAGYSTMQRVHVPHVFPPLNVTSKTIYYLVASDTGGTGATIYFLNQISDMFLYLECAYL